MRRLALAAALVLAACGWEGTGEIIGKHHQAAYDVVSLEPQYTSVCTGSGAQFRCQQVLTGVIPVTRHHRERWLLTVRDSEDGKVHEVSVSAGEFHSVTQGQTWSNEGRD